jgi:hypothetical protein
MAATTTSRPTQPAPTENLRPRRGSIGFVGGNRCRLCERPFPSAKARRRHEVRVHEYEALLREPEAGRDDHDPHRHDDDAWLHLDDALLHVDDALRHEDVHDGNEDGALLRGGDVPEHDCGVGARADTVSRDLRRVVGKASGP